MERIGVSDNGTAPLMYFEAGSKDSRLQSLLRLPVRELKAEMWKLSKADREELIQQYKSHVTPAMDAGSVRAQLVILGDRKAAEQQVGEMVGDLTHFHRNLGASGNPYVVESLAPHFFKEEPYLVTAGDVAMVPLSYAASSIAIHVLADSSAFNGEVASWARRLSNSSPVNLRSEMRRWWKENEPFFQKEDFLAVKPGLAILNEKPANSEFVVSPSVAPPNITQSQIASQQPSDPTGSNILLYIWGVLLLLLIAAFVLMARSQHGRNV